MLNKTISRRSVLQLMGVTAGISIIEKAEGSIPKLKPKENPAFTFCLNMATIRGHKLGFVKELETASAAGFRSVEIWIDSFNEYLTKGGSIADTKKRLNDLGLKIENSISFNKWIVDDVSVRKDGFEQM